jgi:hypothetical protein
MVYLTAFVDVHLLLVSFYRSFFTVQAFLSCYSPFPKYMHIKSKLLISTICGYFISIQTNKSQNGWHLFITREIKKSEVKLDVFEEYWWIKIYCRSSKQISSIRLDIGQSFRFADYNLYGAKNEFFMVDGYRSKRTIL